MSKLPKAWITAGTKAEKVESRIDMSADVAGMGKCPECKTPMQVVTSGKGKVWACVADRISLPLPDDYKE